MNEVTSGVVPMREATSGFRYQGSGIWVNMRPEGESVEPIHESAITDMLFGCWMLSDRRELSPDEQSDIGIHGSWFMVHGLEAKRL